MSAGESADEDETKSDTARHEIEERVVEVISSEKTKESDAADSQPELESNANERNKEQSEDDLEYEPLLEERTERVDEEKTEPASEFSISSVVDHERLKTSDYLPEPAEVVESTIEPQKKPGDIVTLERLDKTAESEVDEPKPNIETPLSTNASQQLQTQSSWASSTASVLVNEPKVTFEFKQRAPGMHAGVEELASRQDNIPTPSGAIHNSVFSVNTEQSHQINQLTDQVATMSVNTTYGSPKRTNPPQSALYRRKPNTQPSNQPWYIKPNYCISSQPPSNNSTYIAPAETKNYSDYEHQPIVYAAPSPHPAPTTTTVRKLSTTSPYVGSQIIASETGPSLTVLLRRPTSERHWGFTFYGGSEYGCPPFVNKVNSGSLALQQGIEVGDVIVSICNSLTVGKTQEQLKADILRAGNELDLVLIRHGVDLEKVSQLAPQALFAPPKTPPPLSGPQNKPFSFPATPRATRPDPVVTRSRSFRSVKTKSLRILEEQLASGQSPSSVIQTKQHFQGARGLPAIGATSTITRAYGQNPNQGYLGRQPIVNEPSGGTEWTSGDMGQSVRYVQPAYAPHESSHFSDQDTIQWDQASVGQPNWDAQSYTGQSSEWAFPRPAYAQPTGSQRVYPIQASPSPNYQPGIDAYTPSANITIPIHVRPQWSNMPM